MTTAVEVGDPPVRTTFNRSLWPYLGVVAVLVAAGALAFILLRGQKVATYPLHSPQRAVSIYLGYLQAGQVDRAYRMTAFEPGNFGTATLSDFHQQWDDWSTKSHRVTLARVGRADTNASVTVDVTSFSADGFGPSEHSQRVTFTLALRHGSWWITGPAYTYLP